MLSLQIFIIVLKSIRSIHMIFSGLYLRTQTSYLYRNVMLDIVCILMSIAVNLACVFRCPYATYKLVI